MPEQHNLPGQRRRTLALRALAAAGTVAAIVGLCAGCSSSHYQGVCTDKSTHKRVSDAQCGQADPALYYWLYYPAGASAPALGSPATGGVSSVPSGSTAVRGGVSTSGGSISDDEDEDDATPQNNSGSNSDEDEDDEGNTNNSVGSSGGDEDDDEGSSAVGGDEDDG